MKLSEVFKAIEEGKKLQIKFKNKKIFEEVDVLILKDLTFQELEECQFQYAPLIIKVSTTKFLTFTYQSKDNVTIEYTGSIDTKDSCQKILDFINLNFPPEKFLEESIEAIDFNLLTQHIEQYMDELDEQQ